MNKNRSEMKYLCDMFSLVSFIFFIIGIGIILSAPYANTQLNGWIQVPGRNGSITESHRYYGIWSMFEEYCGSMQYENPNQILFIRPDDANLYRIEFDCVEPPFNMNKFGNLFTNIFFSLAIVCTIVKSFINVRENNYLMSYVLIMSGLFCLMILNVFFNIYAMNFFGRVIYPDTRYGTLVQNDIACKFFDTTSFVKCYCSVTTSNLVEIINYDKCNFVTNPYAVVLIVCAVVYVILNIMMMVYSVKDYHAQINDEMIELRPTNQ